jgi:hypothetical protein
MFLIHLVPTITRIDDVDVRGGERGLQLMCRLFARKTSLTEKIVMIMHE